ncbi:ATP-dependent RNA helicase DDX18 [Fukomys damarensis]|uniref:ATP-dependent RNA helicase DDX18 n=1 Tax=Fukomys damarensis TaxID=885580 RepID=A0A091D765_FUKDA|nr:ATP-dependent RNA helicase DDX18 [Fukomys damarensis]
MVNDAGPDTEKAKAEESTKTCEQTEDGVGRSDVDDIPFWVHVALSSSSDWLLLLLEEVGGKDGAQLERRFVTIKAETFMNWHVTSLRHVRHPAGSYLCAGRGCVTAGTRMIIGLDDVIISIFRDAGKEAIKIQSQHSDLGLLPRKKVSVKDHGTEGSSSSHTSFGEPARRLWSLVQLPTPGEVGSLTRSLDSELLLSTHQLIVSCPVGGVPV